MTQKEFWAEVATRTSKEVADFGFECIAEDDLPGTTTVVSNSGQMLVECADLDFAARTAEQAFDQFGER